MRDSAAAMYHTHEKYNYLRTQQIQAGELGFGLLKDEKTPMLPTINNVAPAKVKPQSKLEIQQPESNSTRNFQVDLWESEDDGF